MNYYKLILILELFSLCLAQTESDPAPFTCGKGMQRIFNGAVGIGPGAGTTTWPGGVVYYELSKDYDDKEKRIILNGMKMIEDKTRVNGKDCIKFKEHRDESNYILIQNGYGCSSYVGMFETKGSQPISLNKNGCLYVSIVAHELVHALGFNHEQTRPDRDEYIEIDYSNIIQSEKFNFDKEVHFVDLNTPYDLTSIMHYPSRAFQVDRQVFTIKSKRPPAEIKSAQTLSDIDIKEIRMLYKCHTAEAKKSKHELYASQELKENEFIQSPSGIYKAIMEPNGNLKIYKQNTEIKTSETSSSTKKPFKLKLQYNGNLVILDGSNNTIWKTSTSISEPVLKMKDCGGLHLMDELSKNIFWSSKTEGNKIKESILNSDQYLNENWMLESPNGNHKAVLNSDGNFVLYNMNKVMFETKTSGKQFRPFTLVMQKNGNLVLFDSRKHPLWSTQTNTNNPELVLKDDGVLALIDKKTKKELWMSNSKKNPIEWNDEMGHSWAYSCDFENNDLKKAVAKPDLCFMRCMETSGCTHYTTSSNDDCWLKKGDVSKKNAINTNDPSMMCGVMLQPKYSKSCFKKENGESFFYRDDNNAWFEIFEKNQLVLEFKFIREKNDEAVIYAQDRDFYLKLKEGQIRWGKTLNEVDKYILTNGNWRSDCIHNKTGVIKKNSIEGKCWKKSNESIYFVNDKKIGWIEMQNGKLYAKFKLINQSDAEIILYAHDRNFYIRLKQDRANWGKKLDQVDQFLLAYGSWKEVCEPKKCWVNDKKNAVFYKDQDGVWKEKHNGSPKAVFKTISEAQSEIVLYAEEREFYIRIVDDAIYWSYSKKEISKSSTLLSKGSWDNNC